MTSQSERTKSLCKEIVITCCSPRLVTEIEKIDLMNVLEIYVKGKSPTPRRCSLMQRVQSLVSLWISASVSPVQVLGLLLNVSLSPEWPGRAVEADPEMGQC